MLTNTELKIAYMALRQHFKTHEAVARALGKSKRRYEEWRAGQIKDKGIEQIENFLKALGLLEAVRIAATYIEIQLKKQAMREPEQLAS